MKLSYVLIITVILTGMAAAWNNGYYINSQGLWIVPSINKVPSLLLYTGMKEDDARKALNREPLHTRTGPTGDPAGYKILSYNNTGEPSGFDLYIKKGIIVAICVYTQNIPDNKGIQVGSNKSLVIEKYGQSCKKETISGHGSGITYEENMGNIFFRLNSCDKIEEIIIYLKGQW
ncbi:MAG: hypothetical protein ABRQ37_25265 [Candidatus Eremiobacterota bacterium]